MKIIETILELNEVLTSVAYEFTQIVNENENENQLPSYSVEQLEREAVNLELYANSNENYVPAYYDCGLLSRALSIAQNNGYIIPALFFINCGYDNETAIELACMRWY